MPDKTAFIVIAEFAVRPDRIPAFLDLAHTDATSSLKNEPGCRRFDVLQAEDDRGHVVFYEVYDDRAAFDAHLETPHLAAFRKGFPPLIERELPVRFLTQPPAPVTGTT